MSKIHFQELPGGSMIGYIEMTRLETIISRKDLMALPEYSCSIPTGVTIGKRWRCDIHAYRHPPIPEDQHEWMIGEYVEHSNCIQYSWAIDENHNPHRGRNSWNGRFHNQERCLSHCIRDTNGDGDCHLCHRGGCPFSVFTKMMIDQATMTPEQIREFKKNAIQFEYRDWLGKIKGWRDRQGRVLIEQVEPKHSLG